MHLANANCCHDDFVFLLAITLGQPDGFRTNMLFHAVAMASIVAAARCQVPHDYGYMQSLSCQFLPRGRDVARGTVAGNAWISIEDEMHADRTLTCTGTA